jgi:hypothetical protein
VNNLIPGLQVSPIIAGPNGAFAYFQFSYIGNTMSGSFASITFWAGDLVNQTNGNTLLPYKLS